MGVITYWKAIYLTQRESFAKLQPHGGDGDPKISLKRRCFQGKHWLKMLSLVFLLLALIAVSAKKEPTITNKVYFDIEIDGVPSGRIVMGKLMLFPSFRKLMQKMPRKQLRL